MLDLARVKSTPTSQAASKVEAQADDLSHSQGGRGVSSALVRDPPPPLPSGPSLLPRANNCWPYIWWRQRHPKNFLFILFAHVAPIFAYARAWMEGTPVAHVAPLFAQVRVRVTELKPVLVLEPHSPRWWNQSWFYNSL